MTSRTYEVDLTIQARVVGSSEAVTLRRTVPVERHGAVVGREGELAAQCLASLAMEWVSGHGQRTAGGVVSVSRKEETVADVVLEWTAAGSRTRLMADGTVQSEDDDGERWWPQNGLVRCDFAPMAQAIAALRDRAEAAEECVRELEARPDVAGMLEELARLAAHDGDDAEVSLTRSPDGGFFFGVRDTYHDMGGSIDDAFQPAIAALRDLEAGGFWRLVDCHPNRDAVTLMWVDEQGTRSPTIDRQPDGSYRYGSAFSDDWRTIVRQADAPDTPLPERWRDESQVTHSFVPHEPGRWLREVEGEVVETKVQMSRLGRLTYGPHRLWVTDDGLWRGRAEAEPQDPAAAARKAAGWPDDVPDPPGEVVHRWVEQGHPRAVVWRDGSARALVHLGVGGGVPAWEAASIHNVYRALDTIVLRLREVLHAS